MAAVGFLAPSQSLIKQTQANCHLRAAVPAVHRLVRCSATHQNVGDDLTRREIALGTVATALFASTPSAMAAAPAVPACELQIAPNGLQFCDTIEGTGPEPKKGALIRCHYTGRLASNGKVFDSSYDRGRPLTFKIGVREVIQGWDLGILGAEGIPSMKEGGKRRLVIPSELAYGDRGAGGVIPPKATLIFDVELLPKRR